jgi:hypothetical protein
MRYRLMNDYSVDWPLWGDEELMPYGKPELPPRLVAEIRAWADEFEEFCLPMEGWPDAKTGRLHWEEGERLAAAIRRELGPDDSLEYGMGDRRSRENDLNRGGSFWETQRLRGRG